MSGKINKLVLVALVFIPYFYSCSNSQKEDYIVLSSNDMGYISYLIEQNKDNFLRKKVSWDKIDSCVLVSEIETFKLVKDILYIRQMIENQEVWYPYLLLSTNKGVSYTEILPFVSFSITNNLINKTDSTYLIHQIRNVIHGDIERELLITLNKNWLPIEIKELIVPFGEEKKEYKTIEYSIIEIPKMICSTNHPQVE